MEEKGKQPETDLKRSIANVMFTVDFMWDPEEAIAQWLTNKELEQYHKNELEKHAEIVSQKYNVDKQQVLNKDLLTTELQEAIKHEEWLSEIQRMQEYSESNYSEAQAVLRSETYKTSEEYRKTVKNGSYNNHYITILYFFALHSEIKPDDSNALTDENKAELKDILNRINKFFEERADIKQISNTEYSKLFFQFIEADNQEKLPQIKNTCLKYLNYPLAKPNTELFNLFPLKETVPLKAESDTDAAKGKTANIYMMLEFEELDGFKISRTLNIYDKYVFLAVANLIEQGNEFVTPSQIYKAMGYKGSPGQADKQKIIDSINIMSAARVMIDTTNESEKTKYKYDTFRQTFNLLNTEIVQGMFKGNVVQEAIQIKEIPKLFTFAMGRNQITSIPQTLLSVPISNSDQNLKLKDYLIRRIARMKRMKSTKTTPRTIKIDTICNACDITDRKAKQRLQEKLKKLLGHFKEQEYIKNFIINAERIEITI